MSSVFDIIQHYQRSIEKCSGNKERMVHCINKLFRLPVTVQHLHSTGIGRTVNGLRKDHGKEVGDLAKVLVTKWKAMVAGDHEFSDGEEVQEGLPQELSVDMSTTNNYETPEPKIETNKPPPNSSHKLTMDISSHESSSSKKRKEDVPENVLQVEHGKRSSHSDRRKQASHKSEDSNSRKQGSRRSEDSNSHKQESRRSEDSNSHKQTSRRSEDSNSHKQTSHRSEDSNNHKKTSHRSEDSNSHKQASYRSEDSNRKRSRDEERKSEHRYDHGKRRKGEEGARKAKELSRKENSSKSKKIIEPESSEEEDNSEQEEVENNLANNSESSDNQSEEESVGEGEEGQQDSEQSDESQSSDGRSKPNQNHRKHGKHKHKEKVKPVTIKIEKEERVSSKEKNSHRKDEKRKEDSRRGSTSKSGRHSSSSSSKRTESKSETSIPKSGSSSRNIASTSQSRESRKPIKIELRSKKSDKKRIPAPEVGGDDSIDCFSGASFAEALGMVDPVSKKKCNNSTSSPGTSSFSGSPRKASSSSSKKSKEPQATKSNFQPNSPAQNLLVSTIKLEPLEDMDVDINSTLPAINPNYRPLSHYNIVDPVPQRKVKMLSEEEALSQVMSTKNQRTKVYSGVKTGKSWNHVPSLYDLCIRVLIENIDAMEYTGGVPFDLLEPMLKHASPQQLFNLEHYNPYLIEDTNDLWTFHVQREFRNKERLEMESSRDMYNRCLEERAARLKALTENINNSLAMSTPVRQTKLAYIDSVAKPPRNVAKKQAKYGTAKPTKTDLLAKASRPKGATPVPSRTNNSVPKVKPKMAPLMQKTMKLLSRNFKR